MYTLIIIRLSMRYVGFGYPLTVFPRYTQFLLKTITGFGLIGWKYIGI